MLCVCCSMLSQIASSSTAERNWLTYGFAHYVKKSRLNSRRMEKFIDVQSALRLHHRNPPEHLQRPATRWDVDLEDATQDGARMEQRGPVNLI
jgi:hypothetical protein